MLAIQFLNQICSLPLRKHGRRGCETAPCDEVQITPTLCSREKKNQVNYFLIETAKRTIGRKILT